MADAWNPCNEFSAPRKVGNVSSVKATTRRIQALPSTSALQSDAASRGLVQLQFDTEVNGNTCSIERLRRLQRK